ncbi:MAG: anthranilate synthase component II [Hyphomicrobiales bacterium]
MLILIDNYDSFAYNLVQYIGELGADVTVHRNDKISVDDVMATNAHGIVLSPGPCTPNEAGICLDLVKAAAEAKKPLFGVCLGHQALGQAFGGEIVRADTIMHGKLSKITHTNTGVFADIPDNFDATRYHSLTVKPNTLPDCLEVTAQTKDGTIMGMQHKELPLHGVQFHPESIASEHGHRLLKNFLNIMKAHAE